jgi:hypothetical protein
MNTRQGQIHRRRSISDSIPVESRTGRNVVPGTSGHCGLVEFIDLFLIFGLEAPMNGRWIRLPFRYPEERPFAITKSPQIRMTVFALERQENLILSGFRAAS